MRKPLKDGIAFLKENVCFKAFYEKELPEASLFKYVGWQQGGRCPFHEDKHAGSFHVNLDTGAFKCFSCGAKGCDIIAFLQLRDHLTFVKALQKLSAEWGE